jgi:hypothetical protein
LRQIAGKKFHRDFRAHVTQSMGADPDFVGIDPTTILLIAKILCLIFQAIREYRKNHPKMIGKTMLAQFQFCSEPAEALVVRDYAFECFVEKALKNKKRLGQHYERLTSVNLIAKALGHGESAVQAVLAQNPEAVEVGQDLPDEDDDLALDEMVELAAPKVA